MSLSIDHITKKFNNTVALESVSLEIKDGEFIAILGPSGCGKTTLLRIVGGFLNPSSGEIRMDGTLYSSKKQNVPVEKRDLGMVFQSFALWPHMTVQQHVEFPLKSKRHKNVSEDEKKLAVDEAIRCTGLNGLTDRLPGELSGGQRQRVSLARAIVSRPKILLMDEPLSALDAELKINMRREIQDIHKLTGATILYVTHDQSEALAMADRMIIMKDGCIEQVGTPEEIYNCPKTEFVATFVSKANLVKGTWKHECFTTKSGGITYCNKNIDPCFVSNGVYPIRPDQFVITKENKGIPGVIVNRQYNGREIHYNVQCGEELYTVYTGVQDDFQINEQVYLNKKEENSEYFN